MAELLVDAKLAADRARASHAEHIDADVRARLHIRYQRLLADGRAANPPPPARSRRPGRARRSPAANLLARLDGHRDEVLRFLDDLRVAFDNEWAPHCTSWMRCAVLRFGGWSGRVAGVIVARATGISRPGLWVGVAGGWGGGVVCGGAGGGVGAGLAGVVEAGAAAFGLPAGDQ